MYMVLFAGSVMLLLGFIYWSTVAFMANQTDATIEAEIVGLAEQYRERGLNGLIGTIKERTVRDPDSSSVYLFASPGYKPLAGNLSAWPDVPLTDEGWLSFEFEDPRAGGRLFHARARPFVLDGGLHLLVGRDTREFKATQRLIVRALLWGTAITLALALAGGITMSRSMLRRIEQINQTSREIMAGDLSRRVPANGTTDDFDQLAGNLNAMLDEIEWLMAGIRQVSDNVAHDLRTPLTRLRGRLEQLRIDLEGHGVPLEQVDRGIADTDQLLATFGALLRIARIEAGGHRPRLEPVDLAALVQDASELYEALAEEKQIGINRRIAGASLVTGDRDLLFQAVTNLTDNAVKYTPDGGEISLEVNQAGNLVTVTVADNGPGIPAEERDKVLQRFYRLEPSRGTPGSGLGLSLVAVVAKIHQATLTFEDNAPGLRATLGFALRTTGRGSRK
ncbi:MAG: HAMP domain-containing histidine kinase [Gammaproteobacteria bacterium]|nr:HAMP domain-containing histidine kinase [Gammaproteobacteria bacterium]